MITPLKQNRFKIALLILATLVLSVLIAHHATGVNGPWYGHADWRRLRAVYAFGWMILAASPLLAAIALHEFRKSRTHPALLLMLAMISAMAMKLVAAAIMSDPPSLQFIPWLIAHPEATSYYIDAAALNANASIRQWLTIFPQMMPFLHLHSMTKPPGAILYYTAFIRTMGFTPRTAMAAGITLGALATLAIPMTWLAVRTLLISQPLPERNRAALATAFMLALFPGFILYFPVGDPVFIIFSAGLIALWSMAIARDSFVYSISMGALLWLATLATFNILVLGFFLAVYPFIATDRPWKKTFWIVMKHAMIVVLVCAAIYLLMFALTGYDPIATFKSAWINQHALLRAHSDERPYPDTIWNDLLFFFLGAGCLAAILAALWMASRPRDRLTGLCIAQLIVVAVAGLLQSETARVWNFMYPLLLLPAALQLISVSRTQRLIVFALMLWMFCLICQHMAFV